MRHLLLASTQTLQLFSSHWLHFYPFFNNTNRLHTSCIVRFVFLRTIMLYLRKICLSIQTLLFIISESILTHFTRSLFGIPVDHFYILIKNSKERNSLLFICRRHMKLKMAWIVRLLAGGKGQTVLPIFTVRQENSNRGYEN